MEILFEDKDILVCYKPVGLATQTAKLGEKDVVSELKNYVKGSYIGLVHRLDQPVEGLLVFGKNPQAAKELSRQIAAHEMEKVYQAGVVGEVDKEEAVLVDYLQKDGKSNTSKVVSKNAKDAKCAELFYQVINKKAGKSMLKIQLKTGRHHQIRVQMSQAGYPLLGDYRYGSEESMKLGRELEIRQIALCACGLTFYHPKTKEKCSFQIEPKGQWIHAI